MDVAATVRAHITPSRMSSPKGYAGFMPPPKSVAMEIIRAGLVELVNDPGITDRARLRQLEQLSEEIEVLIFDLRARFPEPRSRRGDPPRI